FDDLADDMRVVHVGAGHADHVDLAGEPQSIIRNPDGKFQLFRIGDAVAARNTHAAIYDGLRIEKDI
ncbi:hypothetical protein ACC674_38535, partial [Rhizobium ruizarguesonis]